MTLEQTLLTLVAAHAAQTISIAYADMETGERVEVRAAERMHAASTMKLAVLIAAHKLGVPLDEPVRVENRFKSLADGSDFTVDPHDDADPWTYQQIGRAVPLRKLLERMIVRSSNLATNVVMQRVPAAQVTRVCRELGARDIEVLRGVEDGKAFAKGLNNTTTAHDLAVLLEAGAGMPAVVGLLARQELNEGIPAALPKGTRVAHKTGSITGHYHDAALVFPPARGRAARRKPFVLVVLTRGFTDEKEAVAVVREISRAVWQHVLDRVR